jgi:hypothetical protein
VVPGAEYGKKLLTPGVPPFVPRKLHCGGCLCLRFSRCVLIRLETRRIRDP